MVQRRGDRARGSLEGIRAAEVAAGYERIVRRFVGWAGGHPDIRAAAVVGSRARMDHPADEWADLDLGVFAEDPARYTTDAAWVQELGRPWVTFVEPTAVGESRERRVLFEGGLDVDVALFPSALLTQMAEQGMTGAFADTVRRGVRILFDLDGTFARAVAQVPPASSPLPPSEHEVLEAVNDFWYHAVWTAKHLRRGELWWAKGSCDGHMKELLRQMIEWHARTVHSPGQDTWMRGRFLEEWADPRARRALSKTFAHYDAEDLWRALRATMDLFRWLSREFSEAMAYAYPVDGDRHATDLVTELSRGRTRPARREPPRRTH